MYHINDMYTSLVCALASCSSAAQLQWMQCNVMQCCNMLLFTCTLIAMAMPWPMHILFSTVIIIFITEGVLARYSKLLTQRHDSTYNAWNWKPCRKRVQSDRRPCASFCHWSPRSAMPWTGGALPQMCPEWPATVCAVLPLGSTVCHASRTHIAFVQAVQFWDRAVKSLASDRHVLNLFFF